MSNKALSVQAAGQFNFKNGRITSISNWSGHYAPSLEETANFPNILKQCGIDLKGAEFRRMEFEGHKAKIHDVSIIE